LRDSREQASTSAAIRIAVSTGALNIKLPFSSSAAGRWLALALDLGWRRRVPAHRRAQRDGYETHLRATSPPAHHGILPALGSSA
jgi:hypothetical protein